MIRLLYKSHTYSMANRIHSVELAECIAKIWNEGLADQFGDNLLHVKEYMVQRRIDLYFEFETEEDAVMFKLTHDPRCIN